MADDLKQKYKRRMLEELQGKVPSDSSKEYHDFMTDLSSRDKNIYEKLCAFSEKNVGIGPDDVTAKKITDACEFARIQVTPKGVYSFAIFFPLVGILLFGAASLLLTGSWFLFFLFLLGGLGSIIPLMNLPYYISDNYRIKASNQMVLSVFYIVTYMRHTSNLERAIEFASQHLSRPLSDEFRKVLWDVETGQFDSVSTSLEHFLENWKEHNPEFVDAIHLIESSLLESSEKRRLELLDKSLDVILDETYEKMLHYAHNLQSPITTLHMLGIILPILGLVILPLMLSFMPEVRWYHISILYNVFLPVIVFLFGLKILSQRPTGYGETTVSSDNKEVQKALATNVKFGKYDTKISPKAFAIAFIIFFLLLGFSPLIMKMVGVEDFGFGAESRTSVCGRQFCFLEYRETDAAVIDGTLRGPGEDGPFGLGAAVFSLFVIVGLGLGIGLYYNFKTKEVVKIFDESQRLEKGFSASLFQLGNRLGDNIPVEIATIKVAENMPNTPAGDFFTIVAVNIQKLGMSIEDAIFNSKVGAVLYYPSTLIESSMKVLIQAVRKGPLIASNALINISRYIKEMHRVEERLTDLMAEVISSMRSQIGFLTPIIAAIVVGLTSMISTIIGTLSAGFDEFGEDLAGGAGVGIGGNLETLTDFFQNGMPTFYFQIIVGLYVVQITIILTLMINSIERGSDSVHRDYLLGKNLLKSLSLYIVVTAIVMIAFNLVTAAILPAVGSF